MRATILIAALFLSGCTTIAYSKPIVCTAWWEA